MMKINKIELRDYGPIKEFFLEPGMFNVIYGANETGKTALVEVITAVLFKVKTRYGKPEDITLEIEFEGKRLTLPSMKFSYFLQNAEIASLLYVRASESALYDKKEQANFWDSLKSMLSQTGPQIPIPEIIKKIREGIGYQPRKNEWKSEKRIVIENTRKRLEQLKNFIKEIGEIENKKKELKKLSQEYTRLCEELRSIENFKKFKIYQEMKKLYEEYVDKKNALSFYDRYTEEDLHKWQELEIGKKSITAQAKERDELTGETENLNKELTVVSRKLELIEKYRIKEKIYQKKEIGKEPGYFYPSLIFLIGFLLLILGFKFNFSILISLIIFLISIIGFTFVAIKKSRIKIEHLKNQQVLNDAELLLEKRIKDFDELKDAINFLENKKVEIETLITAKSERLKELSSSIPAEEVERQIEELRHKTGCGEISKLKEKLFEKKKIQDELNGISAKLFSYLGEKDETKWQRLIDEKKFPPPQKEYDITIADELEKQVKNIEEEVHRLQRDIKIFEDVKKSQYGITSEDQALKEISEIEAQLSNYDLELKAVLKAEEILNQISSELDNFIENIVSGEDSLSEYFYKVTRKYKKIKIENQDFVAVDEEGNEYPINLLSSGARDQLLLCFRFSALKKLFPAGIFLLLDDAFIFSDWERRCRLAELLKKFVDEGNQVFYFTSDEHSRDLLARYGASVTTL
jgi:exonuclease SbcC